MIRETTFQGQVLQDTVDRLSVQAEEVLSRDGYRVLWYHSTRTAELDARRRTQRLQRGIQKLTALRDRLRGLKSRLRERGQVEAAV